MGLLDSLPETTDAQELQERQYLEEALKGIMISRTDEAAKETVVSFIAQVGEAEAVALLINVLSIQEAASAETPLSVASVRALQQIGQPALDPLIEALENDDDLTRKRASLALGKMGDGRAIEPLKPLLSDPKSFVREAALDALDELGAEDVA